MAKGAMHCTGIPPTNLPVETSPSKISDICLQSEVEMVVIGFLVHRCTARDNELHNNISVGLT